VRRAVLLLLAPLALTACGGGSAPQRAPVRLTVDSPSDGAHLLADTATVSGSVSPRTASVLVAGRRVKVDGGTFSTQVNLTAGTNVVDVLAGSTHSPAAMAAVRIYREVTIEVPDVTGEKPSEAAVQLTERGLKPTTENPGGDFDFLIPRSRRVCSTDPEAGRRVAPGSTVKVITGKFC
jgi:Glucodextranase, domain B/PASTA domain